MQAWLIFANGGQQLQYIRSTSGLSFVEHHWVAGYLTTYRKSISAAMVNSTLSNARLVGPSNTLGKLPVWQLTLKLA